ncbi:hypothetical protein A0257_03795 [Hymenobacter psoromatis]|nr:hypothetical protein A0257_03795 [Hymenobacter psoromatis]
MSLFANLDRLRADLDALRPLAPEQEARVLQKFRLEWNYNSNAIEGNSLTLGETRSLLLHGLTAAGKPMRDHLDIKGHNEAVHALEDFVRAERPLTEHFIREMHQVLLGEAYEVPAQTPDGQPTRKLIQPGRYKSSPNNVLTTTGEMFYFASPEETPARMTDLVDWYRQQEPTPALPPVALAAEFHYRFVRIHPFDDGNGRMARLLMNLILLRHGYPMTVIKAADRNRYLAALAAADADEFEPFLSFIAENVEDSLRLMIRAARGESIEEPSDLDKKLALLKIEVEGYSEHPRRIWNETTQAKFAHSFLLHWFDDLMVQTGKFDFAFESKIFRLSASETDSYDVVGSSMSPSSKGIRNLLEPRLNSGNILNNLAFYIVWDVFKKESALIDLTLGIRFRFNRREFYISYSLLMTGSKEYYGFDDSLQLFASPYLIEYDHAQIHEINLQLANKVYDFIAAKLA